MLEQTESFKVELNIFNDPIGRVLVGKSEATVTIINDNSKMKSTVYSHCVHYVFDNVSDILFITGAIIALELEECDVQEEDGEVIVCVVITEPQIPCPVAFPFELVFQTTAGTAGAVTSFILEH